MSDEPISIESRFELGDFELQSGNVLPNAHMGFAAYGALNEARDNVLVYPTWYTGRHQSSATSSDIVCPFKSG